MKFIILFILSAVIALTDAKSQDKKFLNQFYIKEQGSSVTLLYFENQNIYYLTYFKSGLLGFCIESPYSIKVDTLLTEKFGKFLIKKNQLLVIDKNEISKDRKYKSVKRIDKFIDCLSPYGIYLDSSQLVIPSRLIGEPN